MKKSSDMRPKGGRSMGRFAPVFNVYMRGLIIGIASYMAISIHVMAADIKSPHIGSTSLCGDSYVLALAPEHVNALSWQSRSALSMATPAQKAFPQIWDDPEKLATFQTDLILFGPGEGQYAPKLMTPSLTLKWGEDFKTVFENANAIRLALNLDDQTIRTWDTRLKVLAQRSHKIGLMTKSNRPKVLYMSRSGGTAGIGTFVTAAIEAAGGQNIITTSGWSTPDPETLLGLSPDLIVTSYFTQGYESVQANAIRHKAVAQFIARHLVVDVPGHIWPCAGPGLIEAAECISNALYDLEPPLQDSDIDG